MRIVKLIVAAAIPFALLGCPDSTAKPDPTAASATPAAKAAPAASGSAAAPATSGGW